MFIRNELSYIAAIGLVASLGASETRREFTVAVYNAEMLFDVDGVSLIEDYQPAAWGARQLSRKLEGISAVLQRMTPGRGPDIICFNEFEADQTPATPMPERRDWGSFWANRQATALLNSADLDPAFSGLPVEAWMARQLEDVGLGVYHVAMGRWREDPTERVVFHTNATFSRFPILATRTHDTDGARGILEVQLDVEGARLYVFNNHWKSGASDPATESIRIGNATVLRQRLEEILRDDPMADVILAGDFNSQYNQKQRYPAMARTALNDVLGSQGDEVAVARAGGPPLYNLWFELPPEKRASDEFRGEWGTLMHLFVTRGLYDFGGVQYVDNSFTVAAFPGLNADQRSGRPVRWTFADGGGGYSDHFPLVATFRRVTPEIPDRWVTLANPSRTAVGPSKVVPVRLPLASATRLVDWPRGREFRTAENVGQFFKVRGRVTSHQPFRVRVEGPGVEIDVWIHDRVRREAFFARHKAGARVEFTGELGQFRGAWQLVIPDPVNP